MRTDHQLQWSYGRDRLVCSCGSELPCYLGLESWADSRTRALCILPDAPLLTRAGQERTQPRPAGRRTPMHPLQVKAAIGEAFHAYEAHTEQCPACEPGKPCQRGRELAAAVEALRGEGHSDRQAFNTPLAGRRAA